MVERSLGRGGSSTVWLVKDEGTGRNFALKCLRAGPAQDGHPPEDSGEDDLRREIRILSALDHPHLVKAHDVVRIGDGSGVGLGLLVEYASGGSLGELVASRGTLSLGETVTVLTPICQVLGYLHGKGFTHSDVSPGNVLFTGHGKPMLADVGISRMVGDETAVPDHGTAGFMDPTPVDAVRAGLQPERDVYAVAALGWYCLTGEPPRRTADRAPLSLLVPDVPGELAAALEAGLDEDRRLRPTAVELATAVYRSAPPLPVDLAASVHPTVIPELLTRRLPERSGGALREGLGAWRRRISTSRWSELLHAPQVMPFPVGEKPHPAPDHVGRTGMPHVRGKHAGTMSRVSGPRLGGRRGMGTAWLAAGSRVSGPRLGGRRGMGTAWLAAGAVAVVAGAVWAAGAFGSSAPWPTAPWPTAPWPAASQEGPGGTGPSPASSGRDPDADVVDARIPDSVSAQIASIDPAEAVKGLAWVRSHAFSSGRIELLDQVNVPGSAAAAADGRVKARLQESGHVLTGFTSTLSNVELQPGSSHGQAVVRVKSSSSSYQEQDLSGHVVASAPPGEGQELRLVLVPVDGRWRITEILPGP
ncbi:serine/threonine-protein kinase [Arthrobacter sp. ISL-48]|uniref:serine/threonine-protein kinase n=1 Tax=Arthrobacter sp. ISL-48 TaxID=2819110 RepID=UPI0020353B35|nr:serine/threonine-protein kinase [Arthrobacter sp. ISL-48]